MLRPMTDNDLPMVLEWRNTPRVRASMFTQHIITHEEHAAWWNAQRERADRRYFIHESNGSPQGYVAFLDLSKSDRPCKWGLYTADGAPKGTGYAMCEEALSHLFHTLSQEHLVSEALATNTAALALYTRLGFTRGTAIFQSNMTGEADHIVIPFSMTKTQYLDRNTR